MDDFYALVQDDMKRWYVVPEGRLAEAEQYFADVAEFWRSGAQFKLNPRPTWIVQVDSPSAAVKVGYNIR